MNTARTRHYGELMRFITPALITVALFMLNDIGNRVEKLERLGERVAKLEAQHENGLRHLPPFFQQESKK